MNIELRHFRLIKEIVAKGSLFAASNVLFQTPSALSYQLKEIEKQVGAPLFDRKGKKLIINSLGTLFLKSGEVVLNEMERLSREIKSNISHLRGEIRISAECHTSYYWLPKLLKRFAQHYPEVRVKVVHNSGESITGMLLDGEVDMMISYTTINDARISQKEMFRNELLAIMPATHPLSKKAFLRADAFKAITLITHAASLETTNIYEELLKEEKILPAELIHIPFTDAGIEMVKAGLGVMVLPQWMIRPYYEQQELSFIPITRKGCYRMQYINLVSNKEMPLFWTTFIGFLKDELMAQNGLL